jgi:hypothetical protein
MHPTMMKLLGEARMQDLSADMSRDVRARARSGGRRYRSLLRLGRDHD